MALHAREAARRLKLVCRPTARSAARRGMTTSGPGPGPSPPTPLGQRGRDERGAAHVAVRSEVQAGGCLEACGERCARRVCGPWAGGSEALRLRCCHCRGVARVSRLMSLSFGVGMSRAPGSAFGDLGHHVSRPQSAPLHASRGSRRGTSTSASWARSTGARRSAVAARSAGRMCAAKDNPFIIVCFFLIFGNQVASGAGSITLGARCFAQRVADQSLCSPSPRVASRRGGVPPSLDKGKLVLAAGFVDRELCDDPVRQPGSGVFRVLTSPHCCVATKRSV